MEYGNMLSESVEYAKEGVWGKWKRWILLVIATIIFPLIMGYTLRVYTGVTPAPEADNWGSMFINGIKFCIINIIYAIPALLVFIGFGGLALVSFSAASGMGDNAAGLAAGMGSFMIGIALTVIVAAIVSLISLMGIIRFARTGSIGEAFNFSAIIGHIGNIGWGSYIIALIVLWIAGLVFGVIVSLLQMIPVIGWIIMLLLMPAYYIFAARYLTLVYDSAPAAPAV